MSIINVRNAPYNAPANGTTDATAAIQNAINAARLTGDQVYIPAGTYAINGTLTINSSADTLDTSPRCSIIGDGAAATRLKRVTGSGPILRYLGGNEAGAQAYLNIADMMIIGNGAAGNTGIELNRAAFMNIDRVTVVGCDIGIHGKNLLSSTFNRVVSRWNKKGMRLERDYVAGSFSSDPNGITLVGCILGNNNDNGATIVNGATFTMIGGSVEGNGQTVNDYGLMMVNAGQEGAVGVSLQGVYFEGNKGKADLWLPNSMQNVAHSVTGCTFNRIYADRYTVNNILVESSNGFLQTLAVIGCGFKGFASYPSSDSRKYIEAAASAGGGNLVTMLGNLWGQGVGIPTIPNHLGV